MAPSSSTTTRAHLKIAPLVVNLLNDDDDDNHSDGKPFAVINKTAAYDVTPSVIDLCDAEDNCPGSVYAASMTASLAPKRSKKQAATPNISKKRAKRAKPTATVATASTLDVIEIDDQIRPKPLNAEEEYRQALGPLRFDFVDDLPHHFFRSSAQNQTLQTAKVYKELLEYKLNLPLGLSSSIFVRAVESRMDLIRALITGPEGTPYGYGCFFFDIHLNNYPWKPPSVQYLTTGGGQIRFNPNLYQCGKVCLSLLGTWSGPGWKANKSTLLQVLISIQALILVPDPYFNEPGYSESKSFLHKSASQRYTSNVRRYTVEHSMLHDLNQILGNKKALYPEFIDIMTAHYCHQAAAIKEQLGEWVKEDATLKKMVDQFLALLSKLVDMNDNKPKAISKELSETTSSEKPAIRRSSRRKKSH